MCWPDATLAEPWNMTCSKRWANPVRPGSSSREPTSYQRLTATDGAPWSGLAITRSPLCSVRSSIG